MREIMIGRTKTSVKRPSQRFSLFTLPVGVESGILNPTAQACACCIIANPRPVKDFCGRGDSSSSELSQLSRTAMGYFAKICSIPHPSYHEEQLAEHIMGWAKKRHAERDQVGNILIRKGRHAGMENRKPVVLQAHLDMVPQKNNDTVHDFTKDPIQPYIDWRSGSKRAAPPRARITVSVWLLRWQCWLMTTSPWPAGSAADHDRRSRHGRRIWSSG